MKGYYIESIVSIILGAEQLMTNWEDKNYSEG